jgi:glycosyltransferase involved in cell wall biosynthesis
MGRPWREGWRGQPRGCRPMPDGAAYFLGERYRGLGLLGRLPQPVRDEIAATIARCREGGGHPESDPAEYSQELLMFHDNAARAAYLDGRIKFPFYSRVGSEAFWRSERSQAPYLDRLAEAYPRLDIDLIEQLWLERGRGMPRALPAPSEGKALWRSVEGLTGDSVRPDAPPGPFAAAIVAPRWGIGGAEKIAREMAASIERLSGLACLIVIADTQVDPAALPPGAICLANGNLRDGPFARQPRAVRAMALRHLLRRMGAPRVISMNSSLANALLLEDVLRADGIAAASALFFVAEGPGGASEGRVLIADWLIDAGVTLFTDNHHIARHLAARSFYEETVVLAAPEPVSEGLAPGGSHVLWAGRLDTQKRPDLLLDIARLGPHLSFEAWGEPLLSDRSVLEALAAAPNVAYRGPFTAFSAIDLANIGCLLYTSAYDGAPNLLIEAMARGVPCVASAVGGIPELLAEGRGVLVEGRAPAADYLAALDRLLGDPERRRWMSRAGRDHVARAHGIEAFDRTVARLLATMGPPAGPSGR